MLSVLSRVAIPICTNVEADDVVNMMQIWMVLYKISLQNYLHNPCVNS
jgi:hypothetical protein